MMGMGSLEVIVILLVAFIFLGPQKMIEAARALGKLVGQAKNMAADIPHLDLDGTDAEEIVDKSNAEARDQRSGANRDNKTVDNHVVEAPIPFKSLRNPISKTQDDNEETDPVSDEGDIGENGSSGELREG